MFLCLVSVCVADPVAHEYSLAFGANYKSCLKKARERNREADRHICRQKTASQFTMFL